MPIDVDKGSQNVQPCQCQCSEGRWDRSCDIVAIQLPEYARSCELVNVFRFTFFEIRTDLLSLSTAPVTPAMSR